VSGFNAKLVQAGDRAICMKDDATVIVDALALDLVNAWCLGPEDHFDGEGHCVHVEELILANPLITMSELPWGGPDYAQERGVDLAFRAQIGFVGDDEFPDDEVIARRDLEHREGRCLGSPNCGWCIAAEVKVGRGL
jgi:hypothetical protein